VSEQKSATKKKTTELLSSIINHKTLDYTTVLQNEATQSTVDAIIVSKGTHWSKMNDPAMSLLKTSETAANDSLPFDNKEALSLVLFLVV
jgi:hypothetical protein